MPKKKKQKKEKIDVKLKIEIDKLGDEARNVFVDSEDSPDDFRNYPKIVVCKLDPGNYIYPTILKLENNNIIKYEALNNYVSTVLRVIELFSWCMDLRLKRKRISIQKSTGKKLLVNEYILEKIPACRN